MRFLGSSIVTAFCLVAAPSATETAYLSAARDAAQWIRSSAVRTQAGLTWPADPANPKSTNATLYSGSPGVVLFMLELHHATKDPQFLADAKAGADELLASVEGERSDRKSG